MDGHLKRHLRSRRNSLGGTPSSPRAPTPRSIATGTALRTREQARRELRQASDRERAATRDESSTDLDADADGHERATPRGGAGGGGEGDARANLFEQSPMYVDEDQLLELRRRPPVAFVVRNTAGKEEELQGAAATTGARPPKRGQSWHSPVHVPLAHRKLVQPPEIFRHDPPFRPIAPRAPTVAKTGGRRENAGVASSRTLQKPTKLVPMVSPASEGRDLLSHSAFVQKLRDTNADLFDRLVQRFHTLRRVSTQEPIGQDDAAGVCAGLDTDNNIPTSPPTNTKFSGVEDAILFFLDAKHKRDVLYFKRKNDRGTKPAESAKLTLGFSSAPTTSGKYMPYDLEQIGEAPRSGAGDYFMMTSTSLVHHTNNNDNDVSGEVIPLSQWIMESKMFSLLLAGIPLFQKFLVRKVFVGWVHAIRRTIYRENCKRIAQCLLFARQAFVRPMLHSCRTLRGIQEIRLLTLPSTRPAVDLVAVQEHQKEHLTLAEMKLIDAKEKLLGLMEEMVQTIFDDLEPSTNLDELYSAEAASVRTISAKWKSAPIAAMRQRRTDVQRQKDTAALDMALLETYIRMMGYMFTESLYLMIIGCVERLCEELSAEANLGAICAAVAIVGDTLELAPSLEQTKHVFLDGLARLIRLVSNFHFAKNAITWSNNRGTGVLAVIAGSFESSDLFSAEFDLQSVLRKDPTFDHVTKALIVELALWFERAAQQMLAFESLRLIYLDVQSVRKCNLLPEDGQTTGATQLYPSADLSHLTGISGGELSRFLKSVAQRLNVLDRSQHACQKLQSSWKVGFLEIQCRRSISEILELISQERNSLHQSLYQLAVKGVAECVSTLQRATLILEDRPQLIEFFCEQMKQVRLLKEGEKQLNQNIRNVDETVRALKRFAPPLGSDVSPQYNVMHQSLGKYTALVQSHAKFAAKVLPSITYQVNTALQKYSLRCQKLLRMYDEFSDMDEQEDMEKNVGTFQEVVRELAAIEKATKLYQEYQKMVGLKVVEIPSLAEAMTKWGEVQELVTFILKWLAAINSMENGIFSEQNWEVHAEKVRSFLPVIRELQSRERAGFAETMLGNIHQAVLDYLRKLSLVKEMAQPWVKLHHWKEILKLMGILNYVSSIGVLITDGYTVTLGFLRNRDVWKLELQIREITQKAQHDAVTEKKLNAMKARLHDATLPIVRVQDSYELDLPRASQLLESFEDDLLTIQSLAQVTASGSLQLQLVQLRDEVRHCEEVLDRWGVVQRSRTKLSLLFSLRDVQQSVTEASFEFQAIDRKWRGMMHAAKGTSSLSICLREVVTIGFLVGAQESYAKLWLQLGTYLDEKRKYFPRFNFLSDQDLFQLMIYARDPKHLPRMVSKCFRGISSLRMVPSRRTTTMGNAELLPTNPSSAPLDSNNSVGASKEGMHQDAAKREDALTLASLHAGVDIDVIYGSALGEDLPIRPVRVSANPQFWMKELDERVRAAMVEALNSAMDGSLVTLFEDNLEPLIKPRSSASKKRMKSRSEAGDRRTSASGDNRFSTAEVDAPSSAADGREWKDYPLQVVILCVHILITHELSPLVRLDRTGAAWQRFWHLFQLKKANLIEFLVRRTSGPRERWIASSILTMLLNKSQGIRELYEDQPLTLVSQSVGAAATHGTGSDVSVYHYSYAAGDSFTWIKLPRFYYDPFEKRCTIHHLVKTFQYEYSFIGGYSCPVLSPLCKRTVLAMSTALSLEHGLLVHSPRSGGCTRKRALVRDLSAMVGRECIEFDYSNGLTLTHFKRILRGAVQSNSVWLSFSGLEVSNMLRVFVQEMSQIVDALRAHQDALVLDGAPIDITNNELAVMVTCSLNYQHPPHQHVFLRLSSCFAPISCPSASPELIVEALLLVNGFKDWKQLSQKLEALFCLLMDDPVPFTKDLPLSRLALAFAIVRNVSHRLDANSWQAAEKALVAAVWEEVHTKVLPERRVAFLKCIRTIFPHAADLEINAFGMLALRAPGASSSTTISSPKPHESPEIISEDAALSYDSDEAEEHHQLQSVKGKIQAAIATRRLSVSEFYVRKLLELYQIVLRRVIVVVVGRGVCGKSTALSVLSSVIADEVANSEGGESTRQALDGDAALDKHVRTVRLYPEAFKLKDIYGEATGDSTWDDGFFSHFFRQNCVDSSVDYAHEHSSSTASSPPQLSPNGSQSENAAATAASSRSRAPASWIVFDGVQDAPSLLEPLRGLMASSPTDTKKMSLPNGDQLECTHESLRVFCEVEGLQQWSPACLSRCGLVYLHTEHMVPYTLLIKSWLLQQQPRRKRSSLAHLTKLLEPTSDYVAKLMRTHLPSVLDVFKRHCPPFLECPVTHAVANMLQVVTPFVAEIANCVVEDDAEWMADARICVAYAATMALGMILPPRARMEFHLAASKIAPQLIEEHPIFTLDPCATLFDIGLRFQDHRAVLFLWRRSVSRPAARRTSFAYQSEAPRRTSAILKARGRIVTSEDTDDAEGDEEMPGDTSTMTCPLSVIYVPTALTVSCSAWLQMIGLAKSNAFVVGESGVGKTLVVGNCLRELGHKERVSATALQINASTTGFHIQRAIENGMSGKLKGAHCPGVGKRALVLLLENLNLDTPDSSTQTNGPCSAMIRQVIDGKGSFIKSTKEFVEFRDLAVWCSFSLSTLGHPRVPSRLLRHFHLIYLPDQTDDVFAQVVPMFTTNFRRRYDGAFGEVTSVVHRLSQFPIQMFKRGRKLWKPSAIAPHLLFSIGSVLSVFISLMNASLSRVPADPTTEFELLTLYFTLQLHRNRFLEQASRDQLQSSALRVAKKLGFSSHSLSFLRAPEDHFFADFGDSEGIARVNAKALTTIFVAGEERFHWYHKTTLKANSTSSELPVPGAEPSVLSGELSPRSPRSPRGKGARSVRYLLTAAGGADGIGPNASASAKEAAVIRRSSLAMVALKSGLPDEKVTAAPSFAQLQNTLDVYSFLQSGMRHLLLSGSDTADRRSTTMAACGTLSFQFREVSTELRLADFIEHVKAVVLEAGLKATQTVLYAEFEDLDAEEEALLVYLIRQDDLPPHVYSSADKVKLHAIDHQPKGLPPAPPPAHRSSFLQVVTPAIANKKTKGGANRTATLSSAHLLTIFRENVRRSLYIVLSVGCKAKLLEFMTRQPSVYYQFVVKTFPQWQDVSADAVCNSALHEWTCQKEVSETSSSFPVDAALDAEVRSQLRDIIIIAHRTAEAFGSDDTYRLRHVLPSPNMRGRRYGAVTTRLDDMLRVVKVLFAFHHRKLENQIRDLGKAGRFLAKRLSQTSVRVAREETSEVAQTEASQAATETSAELAAQEVIEREARRLFLLDDERCAKIQSQIEVERASIQRELAKTLPDVQEATEALSQINKYHIVEMKSFTNPPQLVRLAMQAVCVLLDVPPTWSEALRILADIHFLDRLRNFDKDRIDPSLMDRVRFYVNHPDFSMENMRRASLASTTLCKWVLALVRYFEAMKRVAPTQKLLVETEQSYHVVEVRAQAEKRKVVGIEVNLAELRLLHSQNLQREAELQRTQETRLRWKSSVTSFGHVIKQWYDVTRERVEAVEQQRVKLLGDCAIVAMLIVFGAEKNHEDREKLVLQCREAIQQHFASPPHDPYPVALDIPSMLQHWVLSGEGLATHLKTVIVDMQDQEDEAFATSLFLMDQVLQVCFTIPFLLDPLDRGVSWIKQVYRSSASSATPSKGSTPFGDTNAGQRVRDEPGAIIVVDAGDPLLLRTIETCLAQNPPSMVLVENASEGDETTIEAALELLVLLKKKSACAVYFAAKALDNAASWTPNTWSHFAVVDFTPTRRDLDNHFLTVFCHSSKVAVQRDIESLQSTLSAEKAKEETLFKRFVTNLCAASDEAAKTSTAGLGSTAASIVSAWASSGTGHQGFYNEESMERISAQLAEFMSVRQTRKRLQHDLRGLCSERGRALPFARRARAFVLTEGAISRLDSSLHLSLAQTLATVGASLTKSLPKPQQAPDDGGSADGARSPVQQQEPTSAGLRWHTSVSTATVATTALYICQRLAGIPTSLHRTYLVSLVVSIGEIDGEDGKPLGVFPHALTDGLRERLLRSCSGRSLACHHSGQTVGCDSSDVAKQVAQSFVDQLVEVALVTTSNAAALTSNAAAWSKSKPGTRLEGELLTAFLKIQKGFLQYPSGTTASAAIQHALYRDMVENAYDWKTYMKAASAFEAPVVDYSPSSVRSSRFTKVSAAKSIPWPPWVTRNFQLLGRLQIHLSLFDAVTLRMLDDIVATHLGEHELVALLEDGGEIVRPSVDALLKDASCSTPLLLLSDSTECVVDGSSSVRHCARRCGITTEAVTFMPVGHDVTEPCPGGIWSYREKAAAGTASNDSGVRDVAAVTRLKEVSMGRGWAIIEGAAAASSLGVTNALRLQIARLGDVKSTNHDFRLWLVEDSASCRRAMSLVPAQRLCLEPPQTLRQHYDVFLQAEQERSEAEALKKTLDKAQRKDEAPSRPPPLSRHASSIPTALQRSSAEQQRIRSALWLFHSLFRLHLQDLRGLEAEQTPTSPIPADLFISQCELDRATRLIQLHLHQRAVAATVTSGASSLAQSSTPSAAAAAEAHGKTLTELAALVYMGRLWGDGRAGQCRELLAWCLHYDTLDLHSADHDTSQTARLFQLRERLVTTTMAPCAKLFEKVELELLPAALQRQQRAYESASLLQNVASIYNASPAADAKAATTVAALLPGAQQRLEQLMAAFPDKTSLSSSIKQLQQQQRESMIIGWGKRKGSSAAEGLAAQKPNNSVRHPPSRVSTLRRQQYVLTQLQQQPAAHLLQVELPAMATYLTFIWTSAEALSSLRPDSVELVTPDVAAAIESLVRGDLPPTWRGGDGYSTPTRLDAWLRWFQQSVAFFHTHQQCVVALAPVRIESIWLPALQRPKALLYSFRHSVSVSSGVPVSRVSLVVLPSNAPESKSPAPDAAQDVRDSIVLSGLFLSNAGWAVDACTLSEQVPGPPMAQPLPPLTVHATTRFRFAPEGLPLPASTAREDPRPLPSQPAGFYRCPLYQSPDRLAALEPPLDCVFLPVPVEQHTGAMAVRGAALFLLRRT
ncbi:hypothetical protein PHYPSEUDO_003371 [Phytophthora pseudosyringae]|uniref:Dynein heavy chain n=1 Tax=Phytophthora pseudosyringae TaxID=221518 RepID=A0A8T1VQP1_9STRA|nr:hypothetical protein PHYPSEUDO_003371 [Phytophthora pseudosyringae]